MIERAERCIVCSKTIEEIKQSVPGGSELKLDSGVNRKRRHSFDVCEPSAMKIRRIEWSRLMVKKMWGRYSDTADRVVSSSD